MKDRSLLHGVRIIPATATRNTPGDGGVNPRANDATARFKSLLKARAATRPPAMRDDDGVDVMPQRDGIDIPPVPHDDIVHGDRNPHAEHPPDSHIDADAPDNAFDIERTRFGRHAHDARRSMPVTSSNTVPDTIQRQSQPRRREYGDAATVPRTVKHSTFAPPLAERLARDIAVHCEAADAVHTASNDRYEITMQLSPSVLPETWLTLLASGSDLSLRFRSDDPGAIALLSGHADALKVRLATRTDRRVTIEIVDSRV